MREPGATRGSGEDTKAAIYRAAVELFAQKGYAATSIRAIASAANIEPASVYNHFSSKEELLYTIIMNSTTDSIALIESYVATAGDSPADRLKAATKAHVVFHCRNQKTAHIGWSDLQSLGTDRYERVATVRNHYEGIFRRELAAGIRSGELIETNTTLATNGILGIGSRAAVWFRPDGSMSEADIGDYFGDFVLRSLRKLPPAPNTPEPQIA